MCVPNTYFRSIATTFQHNFHGHLLSSLFVTCQGREEQNANINLFFLLIVDAIFLIWFSWNIKEELYATYTVGSLHGATVEMMRTPNSKIFSKDKRPTTFGLKKKDNALKSISTILINIITRLYRVYSNFIRNFSSAFQFHSLL